MTSAVLETARAYVAAGLSVIPNGCDDVPSFTASEELGLFLDQFAAHAVGPLVTEVRALNVPSPDRGGVTLAGFFDLAADAGRRALEESVAMLVGLDPEMQPSGVYVAMNPISPDLHRRSPNHLRVMGAGECAGDVDVVRRRWLVVDVDPTRPARTSATDAEKAAAWRIIDDVRADLNGRGWPRPVLCDSGNGFHLWYPVDAAAGDGDRTERVLKGLQQKYGRAEAKIDTSMYNPSRIAKLPGSWARKGKPSADRPHRMARVLEAPPL